MSVCLSVCAYICLSVSVPMSVCLYVPMSVCVCACVCLFVCLSVCLCLCLYISVCVCLCMSACVCACVQPLYPAAVWCSTWVSVESVQRSCSPRCLSSSATSDPGHRLHSHHDSGQYTQHCSLGDNSHYKLHSHNDSTLLTNDVDSPALSPDIE